MLEPIAFFNGQWLPQAQMAIPVQDTGFVMGVTVVDFARTFHQRLDSWPAHLARFQQGVQAVRFPRWPWSDDELTAIAEEAVRRNAPLVSPPQELALVTFATPGRIGDSLGPSASNAPTLGMRAFPLPFERYRDLVRDGAWLRACTSIAAPTDAWVSPAIKHRSRLHWWLAEQEVASFDDGASNALLLDDAGNVTETAYANIVLVSGNEVASPKRTSILPGVSLQAVEELCGEIGLPFHERDLTLDDCLNAQELLLCSTGFCLAPVRKIDDTDLPTERPTFRRLLKAWNRRVGLDIHAQILGIDVG
jgi:branched-chain amino acid aminotransferase